MRESWTIGMGPGRHARVVLLDQRRDGWYAVIRERPVDPQTQQSRISPDTLVELGPFDDDQQAAAIGREHLLMAADAVDEEDES